MSFWLSEAYIDSLTAELLYFLRDIYLLFLLCLQAIFRRQWTPLSKNPLPQKTLTKLMEEIPGTYGSEATESSIQQMSKFKQKCK